MQEWLNWPAWKASKPQKGFRGSNPLLSATKLQDLAMMVAGSFFCGCDVPFLVREPVEAVAVR